MRKKASGGLREEAKNWRCNQFAIAEHGGDAAGLLRKAADAIEQLGDIEILDITFGLPLDPPALELKVSVYFYFRSEPSAAAAGRSPSRRRSKALKRGVRA